MFSKIVEQIYWMVRDFEGIRFFQYVSFRIKEINKIGLIYFETDTALC